VKEIHHGGTEDTERIIAKNKKILRVLRASVVNSSALSLAIKIRAVP